MRIEYLTIFEANKANRLLEERRKTLIERDHHFGVTRFEVTTEEMEYLEKEGIEFEIMKEQNCFHKYHVMIDNDTFCASCGIHF